MEAVCEMYSLSALRSRRSAIREISEIIRPVILLDQEKVWGLRGGGARRSGHTCRTWRTRRHQVLLRAELDGLAIESRVGWADWWNELFMQAQTRSSHALTSEVR